MKKAELTLGAAAIAQLANDVFIELNQMFKDDESTKVIRSEISEAFKYFNLSMKRMTNYKDYYIFIDVITADLSDDILNLEQLYKNAIIHLVEYEKVDVVKKYVAIIDLILLANQYYHKIWGADHSKLAKINNTVVEFVDKLGDPTLNQTKLVVTNYAISDCLNHITEKIINNIIKLNIH
jgi:hypothetical protein